MTPVQHHRAPSITRRGFVERLGLGIGAALLSPITQTLVNEARAEVVPRQIAGFWIMGNGIHPAWNFTPPEFMPASDPKLEIPILDGPKDYTWPVMFKALEPYRSRMLLIDGLASRERSGGGGHGTGFFALSCVPAPDGRSNLDGPPGAPSIDQFIASRIGPNTVRKSLLIGVSQNPDPQRAAVFASAKYRAEPAVQSPSMLFSDVFGPLVADASGVKRGSLRQRIIFDTLRVDIGRLRSSLVGSERDKLDGYLEIMEDFEKREKLLGALSCTTPAMPVPAKAPEDVLESMNDICAVGLACGISNVMGVDVGCGWSHSSLPNLQKAFVGSALEGYKFDNGFSNIGHHGRSIQAPALDIAYNWIGRMQARTIETLAKVRVGNGSLWDNSVFAFLSDNGEEHHAGHHRWPVAVIGNAGGKLRADGRFLRFPKRGSAGSRSLADLFCSIATASGAPTKDFGRDPGGGERVQGPIELIMT